MMFIGMLMNFGALLIPVFYFMITHFRGAARRLMLIGVSLQIFWALAIWGMAFFGTRAGVQDAWKIWGMLLPVNLASLIYYLIVLLIEARKAKSPK